jgi:hypothetical protein
MIFEAVHSRPVTIEPEQDAITVRWSPQQSDVMEIIARPAFRRHLARAMLLTGAVLAVGILLALTEWLRPAGIAWATAGGTLLLYAVLVPRRTLQLRWRSDPLARDPVEYTFDRMGVLRKQTDFECRWGWSRIRGVEESRRAFLLLFGDGRSVDGPVLVIPKRAFADPTSESSLRTLLHRYVDARDR